MTDSEQWKQASWFTSPWNFLPEVRDGMSLPTEVQVHDVTLRDGEQQAGVVFTADDKVTIAEALSAAGVQRIEAGLPAVSREDELAVRRIVAAALPSEIYAFSRCSTEDVRRAADCGVSGVVMEIPSSHHLITEAYRWPVEKAIDLSIEATALAHSLGLKVSFFPIDATRASVAEYLQLMEKVAQGGHVDSVGLVDTFGVLNPHAVSLFVRRTQDLLGVPVETHFHMDFGLGVANTLLAVACGAGVVQTTVTGLGERAGNTPMEETVLALQTLYGVDTGIRLPNLKGLSDLVLRLAGVVEPSNRPVVGDRLFEVESGIIATWVKNVGDNVVDAFPYRPELVGGRGPEVVLGKGSGLDSVLLWLDRLGATASMAESEAILQEVKSLSLAKKRTLNEDEFMEIVTRVKG